MADIIRFDTNLREFDLNGKVTVWFNPTDMDFIDRVFAAVETLDKGESAFYERAKEADDAQMFALAREHDREVREALNGVFGQDICTPLFGSMSSFALADGLPVWANLLLAIVDTLDGEFAEQKKRTNPRLEKYTAKYQKRQQAAGNRQ